MCFWIYKRSDFWRTPSAAFSCSEVKRNRHLVSSQLTSNILSFAPLDSDCAVLHCCGNSSGSFLRIWERERERQKEINKCCICCLLRISLIGSFFHPANQSMWGVTSKSNCVFTSVLGYIQEMMFNIKNLLIHILVYMIITVFRLLMENIDRHDVNQAERRWNSPQSLHVQMMDRIWGHL